MNVGIVGPFPPPVGGMAVQADLLARMLSKDGVAVRKIRTNRDLKGFIASIPGLRTAFKFGRLNLHLVSFLPKTDVVHLFSGSRHAFFLESLPTIIICRLLRRRLVLNYHGGQAEMFLKKWKSVVALFLRMASVIVVPSDFLRSVFEKFGLSCEVIPNMIDIDTFRYRFHEKIPPRIVNVRHLSMVYNIDCTLKAFKIIKGEMPEASLILAGSGPEEERLRELSRRLELEDVIFLGGVEMSDLPALYGEGGVSINSSDFDNMPLTILEAFAAGLPVVSTRVGGIPYIIRHEYNGLLVDPDDHKGLAREVLRLFKDQDLARKLAENGRRDCEEKYAWPSIKEHLFKVYSGDVRK